MQHWSLRTTSSDHLCCDTKDTRKTSCPYDDYNMKIKKKKKDSFSSNNNYRVQSTRFLSLHPLISQSSELWFVLRTQWSTGIKSLDCEPVTQRGRTQNQAMCSIGQTPLLTHCRILTARFTVSTQKLNQSNAAGKMSWVVGGKGARYYIWKKHHVNTSSKQKHEGTRHDDHTDRLRVLWISLQILSSEKKVGHQITKCQLDQCISLICSVVLFRILQIISFPND